MRSLFSKRTSKNRQMRTASDMSKERSPSTDSLSDLTEPLPSPSTPVLDSEESTSSSDCSTSPMPFSFSTSSPKRPHTPSLCLHLPAPHVATSADHTSSTSSIASSEPSPRSLRARLRRLGRRTRKKKHRHSTIDFEKYEASSAWMRLHWRELRDLPLNTVRMPGSHDAGAYRCNSRVGRPWIRTQALCILEQLLAGSRYLDLRVKEQSNGYWIHHGGWLCVKLSEVLEDLRLFAERYNRPLEAAAGRCLGAADREKDAAREIVVIRFDHWEVGDKQKVTDYILSSIGHDHIIKVAEDNPTLVGVRTCRDLTSGGGSFVIISELMSDRAPTFAHKKRHITAPYSKEVYVGGADVKHANRILSWSLNTHSDDLASDKDAHAKLWVLQAICTPLTSSVGDLSKFMNRFIADEAWPTFEKRPMNIMLLDFLGRHSPELVATIVASNFRSNCKVARARGGASCDDTRRHKKS